MTSNLDSQRQFSYGDTISSQSRPRTQHRTEISRSFDPQLHSTAVGASSSLNMRHTRAPGRVHYSDTVLYLGGQPGKTSPTRHVMSASSRVSSRDRGHSIQTNLPNGISSFSSNDIKYTHQPAATSSLNHGSSHQLSSSTVRRDDVMGGRSFPRGQEVMDANDDDDDVLMVDDLDTSPQSLSDDLLVGGASSYGDLRLNEEGGELSDISELLVVQPPQPRPATSVSEEPL